MAVEIENMDGARPLDTLEAAGIKVAQAAALSAAIFTENQEIPKPETFDDFLAVVTLVLDQSAEIDEALSAMGPELSKWIANNG
jgi:hypothetical protein